MQQAQPDLVFHLASIFVAEHTSDYILNLVQSNITFGAQILEAMTQCQVRYLVNTGTSWQNFENQEYNPVNLYAATKQAFEDILIYYIQAAAIGAITLRLFDTYGPDDPRPKLFSALQKSARTKTPLEMSPGDQLIDLVHVEDVAEAYLVAARRLLDGKGKGHEVYAVSSAKPVRLRDLVAIYQRLTGCSFEVNWGRRPYREREVMLPWSKGKRLPEWKPRISLEQGISSLGVPHHFQS
jgi:nucleoside-diphosphate-sugar epimerase